MDGPPPGFRFYPTEPELVGFYLWNKLEHRRPEMERLIPVVDVYTYEPPELPERSGEASIRDTEEWFFFCPRQQREARGGRPSRTTRSGYWKATGSPTPVFHDNRIIGIKKTMVFYEGKAPHGCKTEWKMNEYRAAEEKSTSVSRAALKLRGEFSLCRVYKKQGYLRSYDRRPGVTAAGENTGDDMHRIPPLAGPSSSQGNTSSAVPSWEPLSQESSLSDGEDPAMEGGDWWMEEVDWDCLADLDEI